MSKIRLTFFSIALISGIFTVFTLFVSMTARANALPNLSIGPNYIITPTLPRGEDVVGETYYLPRGELITVRFSIVNSGSISALFAGDTCQNTVYRHGNFLYA